MKEKTTRHKEMRILHLPLVQKRKTEEKEWKQNGKKSSRSESVRSRQIKRLTREDLDIQKGTRGSEKTTGITRIGNEGKELKINKEGRRKIVIHVKCKQRVALRSVMEKIF